MNDVLVVLIVLQVNNEISEEIIITDDLNYQIYCNLNQSNVVIANNRKVNCMAEDLVDSLNWVLLSG